MNAALASSYLAVTERPGQLASRMQLEMMEARYAWAAEHSREKDVLEAACGAGMGLPVLGGCRALGSSRRCGCGKSAFSPGRVRQEYEYHGEGVPRRGASVSK